MEDLQAQGFQSRYLDRLRERLNVFQTAAGLEMEIIQEMAEALGRTEDKLNVALLKLEVIDKEVADLTARAERGEPVAERLRASIEAFNQQRDEAVRCLRDLVIHREAIGFRRHPGLESYYPIPPRKVLR